MSRRAYLLIAVLAIAGALGGLLAGSMLRPTPDSASARPAAKGLAIGSRRPDLNLPDLDGRTHSIAQWDGQLVLVNFWASWCPPCIEEIPLLNRTQNDLAARGLQVIGIAEDDAPSIRAFLAQHPVGYPVLIDDPTQVPDMSQIYGDARDVLPYTVLIGRDGRILARHYGGFTQKELETWLAPHL
ncbi:MAG: TlpA family protein disulfide reductase [Rhodanobacter sp.]|jgi:peroxiredoxin|nr:TlpA family protein disulfide reductase [Rhodanobacter sp.]